ncbi:DNA-directed RNA polymerase iii subunit rpc1 [Anaeramoeba flamelloides]|uniref:DNA-directed RNA polymerase subunit n=1 Tax=Anaeramoeba flamelloides TaxID=1746091 RepID=A0AAV7ZK30_9EUKA|nr:DNA-directed RNA polymerase iii subunit rpc1 [Anaeramoeba flamelloides]
MKVSSIQFSVLDELTTNLLSECEVVNREIYQVPQREPVPYGPLDRKLGVSDRFNTCTTCNKRLAECSGHFGHIKLALPVYHIGQMKVIISVLHCICKKCSRILLTNNEISKYMNSMSSKSVSSEVKARKFKDIRTECKKKKFCPHCKEPNGNIKKVGNIKIIHMKFRNQNSEDRMKWLEDSFQKMVINKPEIEQFLSKTYEDLTPLTVRELFQKIPVNDVYLLNMNPNVSLPEDMVLTHCPVPPVCIRPSVMLSDSQGSNEDDLTIKLTDILTINNTIKSNMERGGLVGNVLELWEFLQIHMAMLINSDVPGLKVPIKLQSKRINGLCQRLKGKRGRFRCNLSGKRVDFSSRTVISPDPNINVDQVVVPRLIAMKLTYPERVTRWNIKKLRKRVANGPNLWPGAVLVNTSAGERTMLYGKFRKVVAKKLKIGDLVERHMEDNDVVLFNRQPSLHRVSIMALRAKIMEGRTFRFNECVCTPFNADFDGDEMNLHLPQTEEARAEAAVLMGTIPNLITSRSGLMLISSIQDFLTACYLLTYKDRFFNKTTFCQVASYLGDGLEHIDLPEPCILKPQKLWSGKQVIGLLINPNKSKHRICINFEAKGKNCTDRKEKDPYDRYIVFRDSELMCGALDKKIMGSGTKDSLFLALVKDYSGEIAGKCMSRMSRMSSRFLSDFGFSIGIDDVMPSKDLTKKKEKMIKKGYYKCQMYISQFKDGTLKKTPGLTVEESLEGKILHKLSSIRDKAGSMCLRELSKTNAPLIMSNCGSKGSPINISQMIALVGQQSVSGSRIPDNFNGVRSLPHFFLKKAKDPYAKGFVANSFYTGLTPIEFFFHTMAGREGLIDTAVKTAETGYMQRRLIKALEDLFVHYDRSVRNSRNEVIEFRYGDDGLDPIFIEKNESPVNFERTWNTLNYKFKFKNEKPLSFQQIIDIVEKILNTHPFKNRGSSDEDEFSFDEIKKYFAKDKKFEVIEIPGHSKVGKRFQFEIVKYLYDKFIQPIERNFQTYGLTEDIFNNLIHSDLKNRTIKEFLEKGMKKEEDKNDDHQEEKEEEKDDDDLIIENKKPEIIINEKNMNEKIENIKIGLLIVKKTRRITDSQLKLFFRKVLHGYKRARIEPGTAVGAISAQSIGEPGTQMTLKSFHFAGVASMNITQGVPRIKEIINATTKVKTPIITGELMIPESFKTAKHVRVLIEKVTLGEISTRIIEIQKSDTAYIRVDIDLDVITGLGLDLGINQIARAVLTFPKLKLLKDAVVIKSRKTFFVFPRSRLLNKKGAGQETLYFVIQTIKRALPKISVTGIESVERAIVQEYTKDNITQYRVMCEGTGLAKVMGTTGINPNKTTSNNIIETRQILGIEAARSTIITEIVKTMEGHGLSVDSRHMKLLADLMCSRGDVWGITRTGITKFKDSIMMLASFERTTDHLFEAAIRGKLDPIHGVSENIIMGQPIPLGTGLFKIILDMDFNKIPNKIKPVLGYRSFHNSIFK